MSTDWKDGRQDYGDGWTAMTEGGFFSLRGPNGDTGAFDGTPDDCDLLHACLVALRERPEVLRAALGVGGEMRGRTVRAECDAMTYSGGAWWIQHAAAGTGFMDEAKRPQRVVVDLLLPEEPPTVTGRVEP